jgi:O-antigen/teichoic acid export membrane protein
MRLGRESSLTFAGIATNAGLAFVVTWLIGNGLGAGATGSFFQLTSLFMIATSVIGLGADTGLVRALSRQLALDESATLRTTVWIAVAPILMVGTLVSLVVWLAAPSLAPALSLDADGVATLRVLALTLTPGALVGVLLGASRGLGRISTYTLVQNLAIPITRLAAVWAVVAVLGTVWATVWAWALPLVMAAVIAAVVLHRQLRSVSAAEDPDTPVDRRGLAQEFWRFSLPRGGAVVLERALDWLDVLIVIAMLGPAAGGVYGVVTRIVQAGGMLEAAMRIVMGPRLSAAAAREQHEDAQRLFLRVTQVLILTSWPFYIAIGLYAGDVLGLFGPEFRPGWPALVILTAAMALKNTAGALQTVLLMLGKSTVQLRNKAVQVAVVAALTPPLVTWWGIDGAAVAFGLSIVVDTVRASIQVRRSAGYGNDIMGVAAAALPSVVLVLGVGGLVGLAFVEASTVLRFAVLAAVLGVYGGVVMVMLRKGTWGLGFS